MLVSRACPLCRNDPTQRSDTDDGDENEDSPESAADVQRVHALNLQRKERNKAIGAALEDHSNPETMRSIKMISTQSDAFHTFDKETAVLEHKMDLQQEKCRKEIAAYGKQAIVQYNTEQSDLLTRLSTAKKKYMYTVAQLQNAQQRIAKSAGYGFHLRVLDYMTALKLAQTLPNYPARTKSVTSWQKRYKESRKQLRAVMTEDRKLRKRTNLVVKKQMKIIWDKFKASDELKKMSARITIIRKKQYHTRRTMWKERDRLAARYGWVPQPSLVEYELQWMRDFDKKYHALLFPTISTPRFGQLLRTFLIPPAVDRRIGASAHWRIGE